MGDLTPTHINWQVPANSEAHRTNRFSCSELVVRRGQPIAMTVYLNKTPQGGESYAFIAETGSSPSESHHTRAVFPVSSALVGGSWSATLTSRDANYLNFSITSPATAPVGRYKLSLQVSSGNQVNARLLGQFILLFNCWCSGDPVFLGNEAERQEYVMNENGVIFVGNANYIEARGWYYGQFQQNILNLCLLLLDLSLYHRNDPAGDDSRRGDPRYVSRVVSSMVNGNDNDNGVLEGKWSEEFAHHENPSRWDGSVAILWKWAQDKYRPVQYGQCWVFAGVAGTVMRCMGIPTRLVTNFNSAHDADHNLSIDKYYDPSGKSLKIGQDSVWDYHVWNECWFIRVDLGKNYNGWQVIDATPQEKSQGIYQCGPASVVAIKQGDVRLNYDTAFVFSEVDADINRWMVNSNGTRKRVYCDTRSIGTAISTKAVGSNYRVDVTCNYKFSEGSAEERRVYQKACAEMSGSRASPSNLRAPEEAASELITHPGLFGKFRLAQPPVLGRDVNLILSLSNLSTAPKTVTVNLSVSTVLYTRRAVREILKEATTIHLGSKEEKHIPLRITYGHYGASLTDDKKLLVTALCDVQEGVKLLVEKAITLESPNIAITVVANKPTTVEIAYANPLPVPVEDCVLLVTLMGQAVKINVAGLRPGERSSIFFEFTPRSLGSMQLQVDFSCSRFQHVKSFVLLEVAPTEALGSCNAGGGGREEPPGATVSGSASRPGGGTAAPIVRQPDSGPAKAKAQGPGGIRGLRMPGVTPCEPLPPRGTQLEGCPSLPPSGGWAPGGQSGIPDPRLGGQISGGPDPLRAPVRRRRTARHAREISSPEAPSPLLIQGFSIWQASPRGDASPSSPSEAEGKGAAPKESKPRGGHPPVLCLPETLDPERAEAAESPDDQLQPCADSSSSFVGAGEKEPPKRSGQVCHTSTSRLFLLGKKRTGLPGGTSVQKEEARLQLACLDWQSARNHRDHHTVEMGGHQLVVRRGQPFALTLHFHSRGYQPSRDAMYLVAETGPSPELEWGTRAIFGVGLGQRDPRCIWRAAFLSSGPRSTEIAVSAPAGAPVGRYCLKVRLDSEGRSSSYLLGEFILLFNPWCPDEDVYLASEAERQEYVLNEEGVIFQGNKKWVDPMPWNYGQFEEGIVDICLRLLDRSLNSLHSPAEDASCRGSPIYVSRVLSAMINSDDDSGVVLGNWSEDYEDGTCPSAWNGSAAILREWSRTGGQPVKYGQCWVFAAVMCTVMRCLGIPTRVVTTFDSGHEKDGDLVIDVYYDENGQLLETDDTDSIWNFHVWNECWMARRDLPPGYSGWQVVDATPQERSDGLYCCGPASVRAVREGALGLPYDTRFVFSMVNADRVVWLLCGTKKEQLQWDTDAVGTLICTKAVGSDAEVDITATYKHQEGEEGAAGPPSPGRPPCPLGRRNKKGWWTGLPPGLAGSREERAVVLKALRHGRMLGTPCAWEERPHPAPLGPPMPDPCGTLRDLGGSRGARLQEEPPSAPKAQTSLRLQLVESPEVGQDVQLRLLVSNRESARKELKLSLSAQPLRHNGRPLPPCWQDLRYLSFGPREEKELPWRIPFGRYGPHLGEDKQLHITAMAEENTSWQKALAEKTITVASPALLINVLAPVVLNQAFPLQVEFANPLPEPVGHCVLTVEGSGLVRGQLRIELGSLGPRAQTSVKFQLTPYKSGLRKLHVSLTGSEFAPIKGHKQLEVALSPASGWRVCRVP
ncbi:uncharacterized protein LOC121928060 [Sceloporus undulatus]|uniref:uncharacterized protein LOC121928060 n=1 Tax=Sceloporus undulatus TaxID=8520 RepID=UPI001C4C8423|nr:uncharacterized protein LOC121928060 [Sceloporus undulatus]